VCGISRLNCILTGVSCIHRHSILRPRIPVDSLDRRDMQRQIMSRTTLLRSIPRHQKTALIISPSRCYCAFCWLLCYAHYAVLLAFGFFRFIAERFCKSSSRSSSTLACKRPQTGVVLLRIVERNIKACHLFVKRILGQEPHPLHKVLSAAKTLQTGRRRYRPMPTRTTSFWRCSIPFLARYLCSQSSISVELI